MKMLEKNYQKNCEIKKVKEKNQKIFHFFYKTES